MSKSYLQTEKVIYQNILAQHTKPQKNQLYCYTINTPLGIMIAISSITHLYALQFLDQSDLQHKVTKLLKQHHASLTEHATQPIQSVQQELDAYFAHTLQEFTTPLFFSGTSFQKKTWDILQNIPFGQTYSYKQQAHALGKPTATRAVANANGVNHLTIIVPYHRIISSQGTLGGYSCGIHRKKWLLNHENRNRLKDA